MTTIFKLRDTNDSINFGQMKNEPFKWIYLLTTPYLVWLIEKTDICFTNLNLFYSFGDRFDFEFSKLSEKKKKDLNNIMQNFGYNHFSGSSKAYLITVDLYIKAIEHKVLSLENFKREKFKFEQKTIDANNRKLDSCISFYNFHNLDRDIFLRSIFKI